jgi:RHS repeat-associated protein
MNDGSGLKYFLTDHLGSIVAVTNASGTLVSQQRYLPFGEVRTDVGSITQTDFGYTGQRAVEGLGLLDYNARMYDPYLNRFSQPDTMIPYNDGPQGRNRYSYVLNNPFRYSDPSGHQVEVAVLVFVGLVALTYATFATSEYYAHTPPPSASIHTDVLDRAQESLNQASVLLNIVAGVAEQYVSNKVLDRVDSSDRKIADTNSGKRYPDFCKGSRNRILCGVGIGSGLAAIYGLSLITNGSADQEELNSVSPTNTSTPITTPAPTSTSTLTPTCTSPYLSCPGTSVPTSTFPPITTPVQLPLTPISTPAPHWVPQ